MTSTPVDFDHARALSFDCYGTLVDWETGITAVLAPLLHEHGVSSSHELLLEAYSRHEARIEAGPYLPYSEVLAQVVAGLGEELGFVPSASECGRLAESLPTWPVFVDTVASLKRLKSRFHLAILSNIDDALFAGTARHVGMDFDTVVTAEQVGSYKPARANFDTLLTRLDIPRAALIHCAQSPFHDLAPARRLDIRSVWIDRGGKRRAGLGLPTSEQGDLIVSDLAELADAAGC